MDLKILGKKFGRNSPSFKRKAVPFSLTPLIIFFSVTFAYFFYFRRVWDVQSGKLLKNFLVSEKNVPVCFAKWSPNEKYILCGSFDGNWKLLNSENGRVARLYNGHMFNDYCLFAAFSLTKGKYIVSGSADNTVCVWDINTKKLLQRLNGHSDVVVAVAAHPTMDLIASGALDEDKTVRLWKVPSQASS